MAADNSRSEVVSHGGCGRVGRNAVVDDWEVSWVKLVGEIWSQRQLVMVLDGYWVRGICPLCACRLLSIFTVKGEKGAASLSEITETMHSEKSKHEIQLTIRLFFSSIGRNAPLCRIGFDIQETKRRNPHPFSFIDHLRHSKTSASTANSDSISVTSSLYNQDNLNIKHGASLASSEAQLCCSVWECTRRRS
jgi:hypothetical protein